MSTKSKIRVLKPRETKIETLHIPLIGTSPLIVHRFGEKAKREMLEKQMKTAKGLKEARDPLAEAAETEHKTTDGHAAFPIVGLKAAMVSAARLMDFKMTQIQQAVAVTGDASAPLNTAFEGAHVRDLVMEIVVTPADRNIREDVCRLQNGTAMLRYRYEYQRWAANAVVSYNAEFLSEDQLAQLVYGAGQTVGLGEWRPERGGVYGTFRIGTPAEVEALRDERDAALKAAARKKAA